MNQQKVAIVTASGRGIGEAIARELAKDYKIVLMSQSDNALKLAEEIGGTGFVGSVTEEKDLRQFVELALDKYGRIDAVVNNTGHPTKGDLLEISDDDWHKNFDLMLLNVIRMMRFVTPQMVKQKGGAIINISSVAAIEPTLRFPVSSTIRAALSSFTKLYSDKYADVGIRMNNLLLGHFDNLPRTTEELEKIPMKRCGTMQEAAQTVRFLLSEDSGYITGQNIRLDGGLTHSI